MEDSPIGCDIHIYSETYSESKHRWQCNESFNLSAEDGEEDVHYANRFYSGRNYLLFGIIAGVRARDYQLAEAKGLPKDVDDKIARVYRGWGMDAHTPSYLTLRELIKVEDNMMIPLFLSRIEDEEYILHTRDIIRRWIATLQEREGTHHRIVFWFDN